MPGPNRCQHFKCGARFRRVRLVDSIATCSAREPTPRGRAATHSSEVPPEWTSHPRPRTSRSRGEWPSGRRCPTRNKAARMTSEAARRISTKQWHTAETHLHTANGSQQTDSRVTRARHLEGEDGFGSHVPDGAAKLLLTHISCRAVGVVRRATQSRQTYRFQADKPSSTTQNEHA